MKYMVAIIFFLVFLATIMNTLLILNVRNRQNKIKLTIKNYINKKHADNKTHISKNTQQVKAFVELTRAFERGTYIPLMQDWAMCPDLALLVDREVRDRKPKVIVEFGSGASTITIAQRLKENDIRGKVYSFEHDEGYAASIREELIRLGLASYVSVFHSPLTPSSFTAEGDRTIDWYDHQSVESLPSDIDLVLVDGPPTAFDSWGRYPALPAVYSQLSEECVIILDDAHRQEESQIIQRWSSEYPELTFKLESTEKGAAVFYR